MRQLLKAAIPIAFCMPVIFAGAMLVVGHDSTLNALALRLLSDRILAAVRGTVVFGMVFGPVLATIGFVIFVIMVLRKKLGVYAVGVAIIVFVLACFASMEGWWGLSRMLKG